MRCLLSYLSICCTFVIDLHQPNPHGFESENPYDQNRKPASALGMDFLHNNYNCEAVDDATFEAYINENGIGHTTEQAKRAINTQAWILHFTNPSECWANLRRSGYPQLKSPAEYGFAGNLVDGQQIPVRMRYPVLESSYNKANYEDALSRMNGKDSWNTRVWWDVK